MKILQLYTTNLHGHNVKFELLRNQKKENE